MPLEPTIGHDLEPSEVPITKPLHLGMDFLKPGKLRGETAQAVPVRRFRVPFGGEITLYPGEFVLATTFELIIVPLELVGYIELATSLGRAGLLVATAPYLGPGWKGCPTLELVNRGEAPIVLRPGEHIADVHFLKCPSDSHSRYRDRVISVSPEMMCLNDLARDDEMKDTASNRRPDVSTPFRDRTG